MESSECTNEFMALYGRHQMDLYRYVRTLVVRAEEADDVVQEMAISLWERFGDYDRSRPFLPWARRFAYYAALQRRTRRARSRECCLSEEVLARIADEYGDQEERLAAQRRMLAGCMAKLGEDARALVEKRYVSAVSLKDLAELLGRSANALYLQLFRIRRQLHGCVRQQMIDEGWS